MFEHRHEPLLSRDRFLARLARSAIVAVVVVFGSLGLGIAGYHWIARLAWIDAVLNASMILTGMGPVDPMTTTSGKLFASAYALFSGVAFLSSVGIFVVPIAHRFLHHFHLEIEERAESRRKER
jgi:hypothetical protein